MKLKSFFVVFCNFIALSFLTSCQLNLFGQTFDVKWWVIFIPVLFFTAATFVIAGKAIASHEFICPACNKKFRPKWWKAFFSFHLNDDRVLKCPHCGRKGFCRCCD